MKITKEYIILFSLIACLCLYLVFNKINRTNYELPEIKNLDSTTITRIEIRKSDGTIALNKDGENWFVGKEKYKADKSSVMELAGTISNLSLTTLISTNREYERYDLDKKMGIEVVAYQGDKMTRSFMVGKTAASYSHTFVKIAGNPNIYHAKGNLKFDFNKKADEFRDKLVLDFDGSGVNKIALTVGLKKVTLTKSEIEKKDKKKVVVWKNQRNRKIKKETLENLLRELKKLKCSDYVHEPKEKYKKPDYSVFLFGKTLSSLNLYKSGKDEYILTSSQNPYPFKLNSWTRDQIIKNMKELAK